MENNRKSLLSELPSIVGQKGWPWTIEVDSDIYLCKTDWPKISIVTPSFNQGEFIEETIRSILLQNYPNLEYVIIDGGSTDNTIEIIKKYDKWITFWKSEKDLGQSDAINKGIRILSGDIFNWINSDDLLTCESLFYIGKYFKPNYSIAGGVENFFNNVNKNEIIFNEAIDFQSLLTMDCTFHQPGIWFDFSNIKNNGDFSIESRYYFDRLYIIEYFAKYPNVEYIDNVLVNFRHHDLAKTNSYKNFIFELIEFYEKLLLENKYLSNRTAIIRGLDLLIVQRIIYSWHIRNRDKPYFIKMFSYLILVTKSNKIFKSRYFYIVFKKLFINLNYNFLDD